MIFNLDRKVWFWIVILTPTLVVLSGSILSDSVMFLYVAFLVFVAMLIYTFVKTYHRCPSCHVYILSWTTRCGSCEKFLKIHKDKIPLKAK